MLRFLARRVVLTIPVLLGVATLVFSLIHLIPGDPAQAMLGESASPRALLRGVPGVELVELPGADQCCGFGGSFSVRLPEVSSAILDRKLANVEATGARCLVACDAGCLMQMGGGLTRRGSAVKAVHLAEVLAGEVSR